MANKKKLYKRYRFNQKYFDDQAYCTTHKEEYDRNGLSTVYFGHIMSNGYLYVGNLPHRKATDWGLDLKHAVEVRMKPTVVIAL